jgi:glycopeptide antibiotics resistance protein
MHRDQWLRALLIAYLVVVLRVTLWPQLADPDALRGLEQAILWLHQRGLPEAVDLVVVEAVANVVMFVPFGVLVPLVLGRRATVTVLLGALLSAAIELTQLAFLPDRVPTVQDVVMNTLGAAVGVTALVLLRTAVRRRRDASIRWDP